MLIHSITSHEFLVEPQAKDHSKLEYRQFSGGYVEGYQEEDGFCISRIISTDPNVYLDQRYQPGQKFEVHIKDLDVI